MGEGAGDDAAPLQLHKAANVSKFKYGVPQTLYGTVIFMPVLVEVKGWTDWLRWHGMSHFWMVVNVVVQVMFLAGVNSVSRDLHTAANETGECDELIPYLLAVALFACTVCVFTDLQETWDILYLLRKHIPTVPETSVLKFAPNTEGELRLAEGGFSMARKICIVAFIVIPKLVLALALLVTSYTFLAMSPENMEIILNATALIFIIEVDESLFSFFELPEVRCLMDAFPQFEEEDTSETVVRLRPLWRFLKFLLACVLVIIGMTTFKRCGYDAGIWLPVLG
mmetsp:Transcript_92389/g.258163  ORF Transcript_92389/g.258163 Transcript_92389/m.258163 type:complete len:282 (-) Transcript_92389:108-953(-)